MQTPVPGSPVFIGPSLRWSVAAGTTVQAPIDGSLSVESHATSAIYRLTARGVEASLVVSPPLPVILEGHHAEGGVVGITDAPTVVTLTAARHGRALTGAQLVVELGLAASPSPARPGAARPGAARPGAARPARPAPAAAAARPASPGKALARAVVNQAAQGGGLGTLLLLFLASQAGKGTGSLKGALPLAGLALLSGGRGQGRAGGSVKVGNTRGNVWVEPDGSRIAWGSRAGPGLREIAKGIASRHGLDPGWLLTSWVNESGLNPAAHNSIGGGLFGLLWGYLPAGVSPQQWLHMSAEQQARFYEQLYGHQLDRLHSIDDVRLLGWGELGLSGAPDSQIVWRRGDAAYKANSTLDTDRDGVIRKGDLLAHGRALFQEGLQ